VKGLSVWSYREMIFCDEGLCSELMRFRFGFGLCEFLMGNGSCGCEAWVWIRGP